MDKDKTIIQTNQIGENFKIGEWTIIRSTLQSVIMYS